MTVIVNTQQHHSNNNNYMRARHPVLLISCACVWTENQEHGWHSGKRSRLVWFSAFQRMI